MRTINTIMILLLPFILMGCGKEGDVILPPADVDFIHTEKLTFLGDGQKQEQTVVFESPKAWVAEIHCLGDWLQADVLKGSAGTARITLSVRGENLGATSRHATLFVYVDGYRSYEIEVEQQPSSTSGLTVSGHVDDGVMTLVSDATGSMFSDTIYVACQESWTLDVDDASRSMLSFATEQISSDDGTKCTMIVVYANYSQFVGCKFEGRFFVKSANGNSVPILVKAEAEAAIYGTSRPVQGENERWEYALVDTIQKGIYSASFYVDSNVRWHLEGIPSWIESAADWNTDAETTGNMQANGNIEKNRCHVTLRVKSDEVSMQEKSCVLNLVDERGNVLKSVSLLFAGLDNSYLYYELKFPGSDMMGNEWALEARKSTVEETGPENRRLIAMPFMVTTAVNYKSLEDAPFHLLLMDAHNGMIHKKQVHWASLKMGDPSQQEVTSSGLFVKQLIIEANERGDSDDASGLTDPAYLRRAFVYLVPKDVQFEDLWDGENLKDEFAENLIIMAQKNDPHADYHFAFEGVENGSRLTIMPEGESRTLTIVPGSYDRCDIMIEQQDEDGEWTSVSESVCSLAIQFDEKDQPKSATFTFSKNESMKTPFGDIIPASPRHIRISVVAFIGDDDESRVIYTIYADQETL